MRRASHDDLTIRPVAVSDATAIAGIYNHYVTNTIVTFEEEPVASSEIGRRIALVTPSLPWLVAEEPAGVVGYAYATPWRERSAYRFSAEITAYVAAGHTGRGMGSRLYGQLIPMLHARGLHAIMGGIALPNEASVALHEKFGLRKVAHFDQAGFKFGRWIDVGYWQRTW